MQRPMIGHRSGAMEQLLAGIEAPLARLFRTSHPVLVGTTSATGFMEMAVRNGVRNRALSLVNGSFSERFAKLVRGCGKECVRLGVPLGCAVEPDMLRDTLRRTPVDAVTLVHSETSTGVVQDVEALAGVVREFDDVLLLVDAVTSIAGSPVETDRWGGGLDFVLTGSQKALALPPGLALGAASDRMLERARTLPARGLYFDLVSFLEATTKHQPTNTPAISLLYALEAQLARIEREGGVEGRWRRHDAMRRRVEEWSEQHGIAYLPREGRRSWTVSCLKVPEGKSAKQIVGALKQAGWDNGPGDRPRKDGGPAHARTQLASDRARRAGRRQHRRACRDAARHRGDERPRPQHGERRRACHGSAARPGPPHSVGGGGDAPRRMGSQTVRGDGAPRQDHRDRRAGAHRWPRGPACSRVRDARGRARSVPFAGARGRASAQAAAARPVARPGGRGHAPRGAHRADPSPDQRRAAEAHETHGGAREYRAGRARG